MLGRALLAPASAAPPARARHARVPPSATPRTSPTPTAARRRAAAREPELPRPRWSPSTPRSDSSSSPSRRRRRTGPRSRPATSSRAGTAATRCAAGWDGRRGQIEPVSCTNRYGALIRGDVFAPLPGARDPYTGAKLKPPYPGVVITTGLDPGLRAHVLVARPGPRRARLRRPDLRRAGPGHERDAPARERPGERAAVLQPVRRAAGARAVRLPGRARSAGVELRPRHARRARLLPLDAASRTRTATRRRRRLVQPVLEAVRPPPDKRTVTPGRTTRMAIVGHSLGASAVSYVQGVDPRVETVVALDKLATARAAITPRVKPVVPALGIQSEYGFNVQPYWTQHGLVDHAEPGARRRGAGPAPRGRRPASTAGGRRASTRC